jgi:hypothetical protein
MVWSERLSVSNYSWFSAKAIKVVRLRRKNQVEYLLVKNIYFLIKLKMDFFRFKQSNI